MSESNSNTASTNKINGSSTSPPSPSWIPWPHTALLMAKQALTLTAQEWSLTGQDSPSSSSSSSSSSNNNNSNYSSSSKSDNDDDDAESSSMPPTFKSNNINSSTANTNGQDHNNNNNQMFQQVNNKVNSKLSSSSSSSSPSSSPPSKVGKNNGQGGYYYKEKCDRNGDGSGGRTKRHPSSSSYYNDVTKINILDVCNSDAVTHPSISKLGLQQATMDIAERMVSLLLIRIVAHVTNRLENEEMNCCSGGGGSGNGAASDNNINGNGGETKDQSSGIMNKKKKRKKMYSDFSTTTITKLALKSYSPDGSDSGGTGGDCFGGSNNDGIENAPDSFASLMPEDIISSSTTVLHRHSSEPTSLENHFYNPSSSSKLNNANTRNSNYNTSSTNTNSNTTQNNKPLWPSSITPQVISQLRQYILVICENYRTVPYHNVEHAYHVFLSANKLLDLLLHEPPSPNGDLCTLRIAGPTFGIKLDPLVQLAFLFSALVHDVDHQGISNRQLVLESDDLAILYNDQSVAEQRSLAVAFAVLKQPQYDQLREVIFGSRENKEEHFKFRKLVIDLVLVTDIASPERTQIVKSKWKEAFGEAVLNANAVSKSKNKERIMKEKEKSGGGSGSVGLGRREREVVRTNNKGGNGGMNSAVSSAASAAKVVAARFDVDAEESVGDANKPSKKNGGETDRDATKTAASVGKAGRQGGELEKQKPGGGLKKQGSSRSGMKKQGSLKGMMQKQGSHKRGGGLQKQGSFKRGGARGLQKQSSAKNLELMSTLDEDKDDIVDNSAPVTNYHSADEAGVKIPRFLQNNKSYKPRPLQSNQPLPQRGISKRHSKSRLAAPQSELRDSFQSEDAGDSVMDSILGSIADSVDLSSSNSSYVSDSHSLEDDFDSSFVSRQKMNIDVMNLDSRAYPIDPCNDDCHEDNMPTKKRSFPIPKEVTSTTVTTNVSLNDTTTANSSTDLEISDSAPKIMQSLSAGDLRVMDSDDEEDSRKPALSKKEDIEKNLNKFNETFKLTPIDTTHPNRRKSNDGSRPQRRAPSSKRSWISRSMLTPNEIKRNTRAHSQERRLGVRRALDLAGSTIEAFTSSNRSGNTSDLDFLLDEESDEVDEFKATVVLEQMMRAADVAALIQDWDNIMKWSTRLYKELKNGFLDNRGEDPSIGWFDNQIKFFDFYILPLAKNLGLTGVFEQEVADVFVNCVKANLERWIEDGERETELMMKMDDQERRKKRDEMERQKSEAHHVPARRRSSPADDYIASDLASSMVSLNKNGYASSAHNNSGDLGSDILLETGSQSNGSCSSESSQESMEKLLESRFSSVKLHRSRSLEVGEERACVECGTVGRMFCPVCAAPYCSVKCCKEHKATSCKLP